MKGRRRRARLSAPPGFRALGILVRLGLLIAGALIFLMGVVWALQGAWILPATFMRGPEWIAYGAALAVVGGILLWRSMVPQAAAAEAPAKPSP